MSEIPIPQPNPKFVAAKWEREVAGEFFAWATSSGEAEDRTLALSSAIARLWNDLLADSPNSAFALKLPDVLRSCDELSFSDYDEAIAYAGLHLLDRYGRVMQVLHHLMLCGRLPIRKGQVGVLEVGAGPAPALYACRDFYLMLNKWSLDKGVTAALVGVGDSLERGAAWDRALHYLSECLLQARPQNKYDGALPFRRTIDDFTGFSARDRHHSAVAQRARSIIYEFDSADEYMSHASAFRMAYSESVRTPSAYDLVFMCNFLTQEDMTKQFEEELHTLANSLTPGGVLIVMGGTGRHYPAIYDEVRRIASQTRLRDISPEALFDPNVSPQFEIVKTHVLSNVAGALGLCNVAERDDLHQALPADLTVATEEFKLPKYRALVFVRQGKVRR